MALKVQPIDNAVYPALSKPIGRTIRGVLTALSSTFIEFDMYYFDALSMTVSDSSGNPTIRVECSNDGIYWSPFQLICMGSQPANLNAAGFTSANSNVAYQAARPGRFIRIYQTNTTAFACVCVSLFHGGVTPKQQQIEIPNSDSWIYTSPSAITNTTAVTLTAATNISSLNVIQSIDVTNSHDTVGTEIVVRSGAGGTVLWRSFIQPKSTININFGIGLSALIASGTGQLLEFAAITTGTNIYINARGYKKVA